MGRPWGERFPAASKSDIRHFLDLFLDAFLFGARHRLQFSPDDKVIDIYKALYPSKWMADTLETVCLVRSLEKEYGVELPESFAQTEPTLGDIFEFVMKHPNHPLER
jgi:acyl carrier protein